MRSSLPSLSLVLGVLVVLWLACLGPGYKWGYWGYQAAYGSFRYLVPLAGFTAVLGLLSAALNRSDSEGMWISLLGTLLATGTIAVPLQMRSVAQSVPPIHDISTDLKNPPRFQAILPLRKDAENPATHGGDALAKKQKEAYPDLTSQTVEDSLPSAVTEAAQALEVLGLEIHAAGARKDQPLDIRYVEATETTFWWGYKDDVVLRLVQSKDPKKILVDIRSVSRVGTSDLGKNAQRIRKIQAAIADRYKTKP